MRKIYLYLWITFSCSLSLVAQNAGDIEMQLNAGVALPLGNLGDINSPTSGFAENGRSLGGAFKLTIVENLAVTLGYSNVSMKLNRSAYDNFNKLSIQSDFRQNLWLTNRFNYKSELDDYNNNLLAAGLHITVYQSEKYKFFVRPAVSYGWFKQPDISVVISDSLYTAGISATSKANANFGFNFTGGVTYNIAKNIDLLFQAAYFYTEHNFTYEVISVNQNNTAIVSETKEKVNYSALNLTVGLQFNLSRKEE